MQYNTVPLLCRGKLQLKPLVLPVDEPEVERKKGERLISDGQVWEEESLVNKTKSSRKSINQLRVHIRRIDFVQLSATIQQSRLRLSSAKKCDNPNGVNEKRFR